MAIIRPSRNFEGGNLDDNAGYSVYKPEIKQFKIDAKHNTDGVWMHFLPPYKVDSRGDGIWYKLIQVRGNFGTGKIRYVVNPDIEDPVAFFEKAYRRLYPDKSKTTKDDRGWNVHPPYGHVTKRVVYNVVPVQKLTEGASIFELPSFGGADSISKYHNTQQPDGSLPPLICDTDGSTPVYVKLDGNKWQVQPSPGHRAKLPDQFLDPDLGYLFNLDNIFIIKTHDELITTLRGAFHSSEFDACMEGWPGFQGSPVMGVSFNPLSAPPVPPMSMPPAPPMMAPPQAMPAPAPIAAAPMINIPKAPVSAPAAAQPEEVIPSVGGDVPFVNPMAIPAATGELSAEAALAFLNKKK